MSGQALEELSALAAIYCEPDACEVLAVSGDGGRAGCGPAAVALLGRGGPCPPSGAPPVPSAPRSGGRAAALLGALLPARPREEALRGRCPPPAAAQGPGLPGEPAAGAACRYSAPSLWVWALQGCCGFALGGKERVLAAVRSWVRWDGSAVAVGSVTPRGLCQPWWPLLRAQFLEMNCSSLCCYSAEVPRQQGTVNLSRSDVHPQLLSGGKEGCTRQDVQAVYVCSDPEYG